MTLQTSMKCHSNTIWYWHHVPYAISDVHRLPRGAPPSSMWCGGAKSLSRYGSTSCRRAWLGKQMQLVKVKINSPHQKIPHLTMDSVIISQHHWHLSRWGLASLGHGYFVPCLTGNRCCIVGSSYVGVHGILALDLMSLLQSCWVDTTDSEKKKSQPCQKSLLVRIWGNS